MFEKKVTRCDDKFFVKFKNRKGEEEQKELVLAQNDFKGEPEEVSISLGVTVSPKQYESIRIDYHCKIHHQPGDQYRDDAFDKAYYYCTSKIEEHLMDLYQSKILQEANLVPTETPQPEAQAQTQEEPTPQEEKAQDGVDEAPKKKIRKKKE
jgi:hypothetical protein